MIEYFIMRDAALNVVGICDEFISAIWNAEYYGTGDFQIKMQITEAAKQILRQEVVYLGRTDDVNVGMIERMHIAREGNGNIVLTVAGRFCKCVFDRRVIYRDSTESMSIDKWAGRTYYLSGNVETAVQNTIRAFSVGASFAMRRLEGVWALGVHSGTDDVITDADGNPSAIQTSYSNLLEFTDGLLQTYEMGARGQYDPTNGVLRYVVWKGKNRTIGNADGNQPVVFSASFGNLINEEYEVNTTNFKNVALIGGAGEGTERFITHLNWSAIIGDDNYGVNRREVFIDASRQPLTDDDDVPYTDAEYAALLRQGAEKKIAEVYRNEQTFTSKLDLTESQFSYRSDFDLGDKVTIYNDIIGEQLAKRIVSVTETQDAGGYEINAEFA